MKRSLVATTLIVVALGACVDLRDSPSAVEIDPSFAAGSGNGQVLDQYIVVFKDGTFDPPGLARGLSAAYGGTLGYTYTSAIQGFSVRLPAAAAEALSHNPNISFIEADQSVQAITTQSSATWGLDRIDQRALPLSNSYSYEGTGAGVRAYIIDTGIRRTHSEFGGRALMGYDAVTAGGLADDCNGHGTHVAGTVGGSTYGVAKGVTLVAVRVLDCNGSGSWAGVIAGIDWVTANRVRPAVANMSLGGGASASVDQAVRNSIAAGVTYSIAAGNSNADACYYSPARTLEALTVGAATSTDARASFSNWGTCVDLFAPGNLITSAWNTSTTATNTISGTSMAAPHVAGVAALYLQVTPLATPAQIATWILGAATQNVVTSANSGANNDLLYSGSASVPPPPVNPPPTAGFTYACTYLSCSFTDTSTDSNGTIQARSWSFGGAGTSTAANPSFTFASSNTYTVTLTVTDNGGASASTSKSVTVAAQPANKLPTAAFTSSCSFLSCTFTDTSSDSDGTLASRSWSFGNGATSTATNPVYSYPVGGTYTVTLTVTDDRGGSKTASHSVTATPPPPVITLAASVSKVLGYTSVNLTWSGPRTTQVDIYFRGALLIRTANDGSHTHSIGLGSGSGTYKVCEASTTICSSTITVSW